MSSSNGFVNSYNGDDAQRFLRELNETRNLYFEVTRDAGPLESCLEATQAALTAAEGETSATRELLAAADSWVAGKDSIQVRKPSFTVHPSDFDHVLPPLEALEA